jgi:hypothetical protein
MPLVINFMTAQPSGSPPAEAILLAASVNGAWLAAASTTRHDRIARERKMLDRSDDAQTWV